MVVGGSCPEPGVAAAGAAAATVIPNRAEASPQLARLSYPSNRLANIGDLKPNEPLQVAYPDADAPGVLLKLGKYRSGRGRARRRHRRIYDDLPAQGISARLQFLGQDAELLRPLLAFRLRKRRPGNLGSRDPKPSPIPAAGRRQEATSTPKASTSSFTAACRTCWRAEP